MAIIPFFRHFSLENRREIRKIDNANARSRIRCLYLSLIVFNCYTLFCFIIIIIIFVSFRFVLFPVALQGVSNDQFTSIPTSGRLRSTVYRNPPTPSPAFRGSEVTYEIGGRMLSTEKFVYLCTCNTLVLTNGRRAIYFRCVGQP
jgi:hypothetical protein